MSLFSIVMFSNASNGDNDGDNDAANGADDAANGANVDTLLMVVSQ